MDVPNYLWRCTGEAFVSAPSSFSAELRSTRIKMTRKHHWKCLIKCTFRIKSKVTSLMILSIKAAFRLFRQWMLPIGPTHMPLLLRILCIDFLMSWKSGRTSGFSSQQVFINSLNSSTQGMSVVTVGRKGGTSHSVTRRMISERKQHYLKMNKKTTRELKV